MSDLRLALVSLLAAAAAVVGGTWVLSRPAEPIGEGWTRIEVPTLAADAADWRTTAAAGTWASLAEESGWALPGWWAGAGEPEADGWRLDLGGRPRLADRAAFGLERLGVPFERSGTDHSVLEGAGEVPELFTRSALDGVVGTPLVAVEAELTALLEVTSTADGLIAADHPARERVEGLAALVGIRFLPTESGLVPARAADVAALGSLRWVEPGRVPGLVGVVDWPAPTVEFDVADGVPQGWLAGTTDRLVGPPTVDAADGGVSWTNAEAQAYRPEQVSAGPDGLVLRAEPTTGSPAIDDLPYRSGLIRTVDAYGYGAWTFDVTLPEGAGLWPAIWTLADAACEGPGRCDVGPGGGYGEIDVVEYRGQEPELWEFSTHVDDGDRLRSETVATPIPTGRHLVTLDRRPGLVRWLVDGEEVRVDVAPPAALTGDHVVIVNLAVGGSYAGDELVGRFGGWWGDARLPSADAEWTTAELVVHGIRFSELR